MEMIYVLSAHQATNTANIDSASSLYHDYVSLHFYQFVPHGSYGHLCLMAAMAICVSWQLRLFVSHGSYCHLCLMAATARRVAGAKGTQGRVCLQVGSRQATLREVQGPARGQASLSEYYIWYRTDPEAVYDLASAPPSLP